MYTCAAVDQIAAQTFIREKDYGLAVSYYTSAEDWPGLGRVVDLVLEEYLVQGTSRFAISVLYPRLIPASVRPLQGRASSRSSSRRLTVVPAR